jgi:hypothetical protein
MKISTIDQLIEAVELVILHLTENKDLQDSMSAYGLTLKRVQAGDALLKNVLQMHTTQEDHYTVARGMSRQIEEDSDAALDVFKGHIAIARSAFRKEPHILKELKINKIKAARWALTLQAKAFYTKAPAYMDTLLQFGATQASFDQNKASIKALLTLKARRRKKKGDAEDSTQQKNEAIKELKEWYSEFRRLARMAFKKNPQVLETFGMVVLSGPKKRKDTAEVAETGEEGDSK